jgi:hypothetical protein
MAELYFGTTDNFEVPEFKNRKVIDEIEMVMSAFDCMLPDDAGIYCSSDITTGKRFYFEFLGLHGSKSEEELKRTLSEQVCKKLKIELIQANVARGVEFTEKLRERGLVNLVNPGPFFARGFDQQHYLYLWEWVIIKKIYQTYFNEDWQYSNGCTIEYAIAARKGIPRFDSFGNRLRLTEAIQMVESAVGELKALGLIIGKLEQNLALLKDLALRRAHE